MRVGSVVHAMWRVWGRINPSVNEAIGFIRVLARSGDIECIWVKKSTRLRYCSRVFGPRGVDLSRVGEVRLYWG